jgi:hypothetical protein
MAGVDCNKEDDPYSLKTPQTLETVIREKENKNTDMESFFQKFWEKQEDFQKKQEVFQKSFSTEMTALVVGLRETVEEQRKEIQEQRREISDLKERMAELEKRRMEGGSLIGDEAVDLMQGMITRQVEDLKEKAKRECQVRVTGVKEDDQETPKMLRTKVVKIFEEKMKVEGAGAMVVDSFRVGKKGDDQFGRSRVVIVRLGSVGHRNEILRGKRNLGEWRSLGVDVDRTKEEMEAFKRELRKKKDLEDKGGKAVLIKGKMVMLEAPREVREDEEAQHEGGTWIQHTNRKGKKKSKEISELPGGSLTFTRRNTRSATAAKGNGDNGA